MANFNVKIPNKNFDAIGNSSTVSKRINELKSAYSTIVDEVAENSNVPSQLIYSMMIVMNQGINEKPYVSSDGMTRSGLFALSNKVGKEVLAREIKSGRLSEAERAYLNEHGDASLKQYISPERPSGVVNGNTWSGSAGGSDDMFISTIDKNSKQLPLDSNWQKPEIAIQVGALWIGQVWDKIAEQSRNPIDKVILTMALPYGSYTRGSGTSAKFFMKNMGFMSGARLVEHRPYNTDYTDRTQRKTDVWIGGGGTLGPATGSDIWGGRARVDAWGRNHTSGNIGGNLYTVSYVPATAMQALEYVVAQGGVLDNLTS